MKTVKYFFERMEDLYLLFKKLFFIVAGDLVKEIRKIPSELIALPPFRAYHEFICFGLLSVSGIVFSDKSSEYYREKAKEIGDVLKETNYFKYKNTDE
jgi:hypothetical protein